MKLIPLGGTDDSTILANPDYIAAVTVKDDQLEVTVAHYKTIVVRDMDFETLLERLGDAADLTADKGED